MSEGAPRFIVIEDHPLMRSAIISRLARGTEQPLVVYEGASAMAAAAVARTSGADCAILDLELGDGSSPIENIELFVDLDVPVLVFSAVSRLDLVREALRAGAFAYLSKTADDAQFRAAIDSTLARLPFLSPEVAHVLLRQTSTDVKLSEQERRALTLYASGMKMDAVARKMGISLTTAQEYIKRVRAKYGKAGHPVSTKTDLYRLAVKRGLLN